MYMRINFNIRLYMSTNKYAIANIKYSAVIIRTILIKIRNRNGGTLIITSIIHLHMGCETQD